MTVTRLAYEEAYIYYSVFPAKCCGESALYVAADVALDRRGEAITSTGSG